MADALTVQAPGANLSYSNPQRILTKILRKMGMTLVLNISSRYMDPTEGALMPRKIGLCTKAGAPVNDTADDRPTGEGDLCWDSSNSDVYRCSQMSDESTFTWTKIVD